MLLCPVSLCNFIYLVAFANFKLINVYLFPSILLPPPIKMSSLKSVIFTFFEQFCVKPVLLKSLTDIRIIKHSLHKN